MWVTTNYVFELPFAEMKEMSKYGWDYPIPESVLKTQATLSKLAASALAMSDAWKAGIPNYDFIGAHSALSTYLANYERIAKQAAQISSIVESVLPLIGASAFDTLKNTSTTAKVLQDVDWGRVVNAYAEIFGGDQDDEHEASDNIAEEVLTPEIRAEIAADAAEVLFDPKQIHTVSQSKYRLWKERHPVLADIYMQVVLVLMASLIFWGIQSGVGAIKALVTKDSRVYDEPSSKSNTVVNITVDQSVTIIGEVPYYYEVEYTDPETGELVTGYIYKANIATDEQSEEDRSECEPLPTEGSETIPNEIVSETEPTE